MSKKKKKLIAKITVLKLKLAAIEQQQAEKVGPITTQSIGQKLADVLAAHRQWVDTDGLLGVQLDLSSQNLSYAKLNEADLHGADLTNADLTNADLHDANLRGADLLGAGLGHDGPGKEKTSTSFSDLVHELEQDPDQHAAIQQAREREATDASHEARGAIQQQLKNVLAAHREWVETGGVAGTQLDLSGLNLRSANLRNAKLRLGPESITKPSDEGRAKDIDDQEDHVASREWDSTVWDWGGSSAAQISVIAGLYDELGIEYLSPEDELSFDQLRSEQTKLVDMSRQEADLEIDRLLAIKEFVLREGVKIVPEQTIQEKLGDVLVAHFEYIASDGENGRRLDLHGAFIPGADLRDVNLNNADLTDATLNNADLSDASLAESNLAGADLSDAKLTGTKGLPE